jgi:antitoxin VapB
MHQESLKFNGLQLKKNGSQVHRPISEYSTKLVMGVHDSAKLVMGVHDSATRFDIDDILYKVENMVEGVRQMALNIKNAEADRLAHALAEKTGESITEAVVKALRERLTREEGRSSPRPLKVDLMSIGRRCAALPDLDNRSADEIIGYDEIGIPE